MKLKTLQNYLLFASVIIGWWFLAFRQPQKETPLPKTDLTPQFDQHFLQAELSPLDRSMLHNALSGNIPLMVKLIGDWEVDALMLESRGFSGVKRLSTDAYLRAQLLGRLLLNCTKEELATIQEGYRLKDILDDAGTLISLKTPFCRFLPQTHVAASFLLALTGPEQIVAIPKGMRDQTQLFPIQMTENIACDIDRHLSETLYLQKPEIAFISHYSHPSMREALSNQGVQLFTLNALETVPDIRQALLRVGNVVNKPLEAELLTIFMEAAMVAVDNRLIAIDHPIYNRTLFLNYYTQFSAPTPKTLTWQLLERLGVQFHFPEKLLNDWAIPLDHEQIINYNPDCLIISGKENKAPAVQGLSLKHNRIFYVDEITQQSPSQYIVLAYYDLAQALSQAKLTQMSTKIPDMNRLCTP